MGLDEAEALSEGDFDRASCLKDPAPFRGKFWRVRGVIGELHLETVENKDFPLRSIHAGVFFDDAVLPVLFHVVQKPEVLTLRQDQVELTGLFVKLIEYTTRSGRTVVAPLFIGKALRRFV
jgi:hypothetical protein